MLEGWKLKNILMGTMAVHSVYPLKSAENDSKLIWKNWILRRSWPAISWHYYDREKYGSIKVFPQTMKTLQNWIREKAVELGRDF
ncbi:hypothetical protein T4D_7602 [Trichinella pseudospiralis]|uniref:Uncharacterized protein n=1 Tax=Trichinella pseudospiralis TaxID=6337 RepID=A0A0V1F5U5_TRIPS|nr:hypothetical protein T4D_7602 [Trichinella pseudospiralis]